MCSAWLAFLRPGLYGTQGQGPQPIFSGLPIPLLSLVGSPFLWPSQHSFLVLNFQVATWTLFSSFRSHLISFFLPLLKHLRLKLGSQNLSHLLASGCQFQSHKTSWSGCYHFPLCLLSPSSLPYRAGPPDQEPFCLVSAFLGGRTPLSLSLSIPTANSSLPSSYRAGGISGTHRPSLVAIIAPGV